MKGNLFGGMKVKGPSAKQQQTKKKDTISVSQTSFDSKPQPQQVEHKESTVSKKSQACLSINEPQMKHAQTSIQSVLKEAPKLHKTQSIKQPSSKPTCSKTQNQPYRQPSDKESQNQQSQTTAKIEQPIPRKDFKKSRSEKNYDGEDSEDNNDVREDRSVVVGRQDEEKEEIQFKKSYKGKPTIAVPKSNPLLNQIKKISTKGDGQNTKVKQIQTSAKQIPNKGFKQTIISTKQPQKSHSQKPKRQKTTIMQQLNTTHSRILEQLIKKKQAKHQIIVMTNHILELKQQLSVLTNKQNHYIANQEYELADKMEGKIKDITGQVEEQEIEVGFVQEELFKMELEGVTGVRQLLEEEKRTIRRLKLVQLDIQDQISHFKREQEQKIEHIRSLSENEKKKYQRIVNDIKNQTQQLQKYQKTFYEDLNSRKSPLETQLNEQQLKRSQLQTEIKQLQEKLKKKKAQLKSTINTIESTKQKVLQVDKTFQEEKEKLQQRKKHITVLQGEKNQQNKKLQQMQDQKKQFQKAKTQQISQMTKQKQSYNKISTSIEAFFSSIDIQQYLAIKKQIIEQFMKHSRALKSFEQKHKEKREKIKQLEFQKSNTLSEITKNEQRIKQLKQKIPKLQTEQKQLSLAKNFKGAGMKKSEIKECTDTIEQIKKQIEQAYATEAQIDSKIDEINSDQEKYVEEENTLRKDLAVSQFRLAIYKKKDIIKELEWLKELQKGDKMRTMYEGKITEELGQIEEEITYIAQEYGLEEENTISKQQQKGYTNNTQSTKIYASTIVQEKKPTYSEPQSSYTHMSLADQQDTQHQQQQSRQKSADSQSHAQQTQENQQSNIQNDQTEENPSRQQANEQSHHTQSREQSVYEPLQLEINGQNEEDEGGNEQEWKAEDEEERHEEEHDAGYVPLQLD